MRNKTRLQVPGVAHGILASANIQILRQDEFDALYQHIPAAGGIMGRDGKGLHAPRVFRAAGIHLCKNGSKGYPPVRADMVLFEFVTPMLFFLLLMI